MQMKYLIQQLKAQKILKTLKIINAFESIDRKDFVRTIDKDQAYINHPLSIGQGQTISQPLTVAFMLELLQPKTGNKILDVGAGSGWQTALLSYIVGDKGKVYAIERIKKLYDFGKINVAKYDFLKKGIVEFFCADGSQGLPDKAPFDKIIVAAASKSVPEKLKQQLKIGGQLVLPVGESEQSIIKIDKISKNKFKQEQYPGFIFVPLIN